MYEVTIQAAGINEMQFDCADGSALRTLVYGVFRAQDQEVSDESDLFAEIAAARSHADLGEAGTLNAGEVTVLIEDADPSAYECQGHEDLYGGIGECVYCDGTCRPRRRFNRDSVMALASALDDADLDESDGCGACGLEAGQMCAACGRCNCDRHDACKRLTVGPELVRQ
ncbi:hypothetical protein ABZ593_21060 [Streptomyces sp. NPDC012617]|uniref:hypothetical protein n=1 Tax=Streptomyces TaxID=1883 RepID=UPI0033C40A45